jgi:dihydropteroate synthase
MKFTNNFKRKTIQLKKEGVHPNKIFKDAGVDISNKQKFYASKLINR